MKLIVIGGGISGLAAAYFASKHAETPLQITLLEAAGSWGGKLVTERHAYADGQFVIEGGPDTFVVTKPWGVSLCKELGLSERLRGTNPATRKTYILKRNKLHELPGGLTMMIPTEFGPMARTGLLSCLPSCAWGWIFSCLPRRRMATRRWGSLSPGAWDGRPMKA
jgi:oxygen-dependent protoporphyrinogen oxidase